MAVADAVDGGGDAQKVFQKFRRDVLIDLVVLREFERDAQQVHAKHRHPARAVGLVDEAAGRQRRTAVKHADIVEAEKTALKNIPSLRVLAVHPPSEIQQQLVENTFEKFQVASSRIASRRIRRSIWNTRHVAHACTGGFTSPNAHS